MTAVPGWQPLVAAIAAETDPRRRANLETVLSHVAAEVAGDLDRLMATLTPEPVYRIWGASTSPGPQGQAEVREHYRAMFASGKNRLDFVITRVVADRSAVVTEGRFRFAYPGSVLAGSASDGEPIRPDRWYLTEYQCLVVWPIGPDGLITGEEIYAGEKPQPLRELEDGEFLELGPPARRNGRTPSCY